MPFLTTWGFPYGDYSGEFVVVTPVESFGDLTIRTRFYRGMSEQDRAQVLSGMLGVILNIMRSVARFLPALSYIPSE